MQVWISLALLLLFNLTACQPSGPVDLDALQGRARGGDPAAIRTLVQMLGEENRPLNAKVYAMVLEAGPAAVPVLLEHVEADSANLREHVIAALGNQKVTQAVPAITRVLADRSYTRRYVAAWALGEIGDPAAVPALLGALDDPDPEVRKLAVRSLIKQNQAAVDPLIALLDKANPTAAAGAVRALGDIADPRALEALLAQAEGGARVEAILALGKLKNSRAESILLAALVDSDERIRMHAAMALGPLGTAAAVSPLRSALADEVVVVREWAARSLEMITGQPTTYRNDKGEQVAPDSVYR